MNPTTSLAHNIQCLWCRHFRTDISDVDDLAKGRRCDTYPKRIPDAVLDNEVDHRQPYEGGRGIVFEPRDDAAARIAAEIFEGPPRMALLSEPETPRTADRDSIVNAH